MFYIIVVDHIRKLFVSREDGFILLDTRSFKEMIVATALITAVGRVLSTRLKLLLI
ncbi:MAG: hypothetical protein IJ078_11960 [Succinivibrionaceae bacterium]|nr:hypothetical protein [Succinivibrionaceae bacterium]